ncbi:uncharacterized protein LY79DRAFT_560688 [Colletotrichum navitas]|uniref:Uncharacterized protein n=1 Tax=Colletotrichum navitas TaxID=681940 RepID=A0AAD8PU10_9PEZI|nr:uncharacterized protein LY79DRAFT_560688 [Colletotrichum navitas]KAK1580698.1 hypothetical protein LY79DRAFT_560688 [Colletotrichum navitas]
MREGMLVSSDLHNMVLQDVDTEDVQAFEAEEDKTIDAAVKKQATYGSSVVASGINPDPPPALAKLPPNPISLINIPVSFNIYRNST